MRKRSKHMNDKLFQNYNFLGASEDPSREDEEAAIEQNSDEPEAKDADYSR
jgi:hypothetical protein